MSPNNVARRLVEAYISVATTQGLVLGSNGKIATRIEHEHACALAALTEECDDES
jgi:hypothetical protein